MTSVRFLVECISGHAWRGSGYYIAQFIDHDMNGRQAIAQKRAMMSWCEENLGEQGVWGANDSARWKIMMTKFYFSDDASLCMFLLRWDGTPLLEETD